MLPIRVLYFFLALVVTGNVFAQQGNRVYKPYIATPQFFQYGNQLEMPIYNLRGGERFELEFDDLEGNYKNYYYSYVLCDYDWNPVNISSFDYIKGFTQNRINTYRYSSLALTKYTHYQVILPESGSVPSRSGNYLLKVFLDGDTSKLVFTKRLLVLEPRASVSALVVQPLSPEYFTTHQKLRFAVTLPKDLNAFSAAQEVRAVVLQNQRWDNAQRDIPPTFVRGNVLDYSSDNVAIFPGGREWRWLDLRSLRLQSDRVDSGFYGKTFTNLVLKPDVDRSAQRYAYYPDYNGFYNIFTYENINPFWQADYATVRFSYAPPGGLRLKSDLYVAGMFTDYALTDKYKMKYNEETGLYELSLFMKQGYYSYTYIPVTNGLPEYLNRFEGNNWEAENNYTILIYYKSFTDRADQLIGIGKAASRFDRPGIVF